jgi:diguanylate cyclase (GGDEF)-like protein
MKKTGNKGMAPPAGLSALRKAAATLPLRPEPAHTDVTEIMGIPPEELTPKVRDALSHLMAQVDDLHQEVARLRARADHLEQLADQDSLAPVLNRRAFIRALTRSTAFAERYGTGGSVLYFDINGMKVINDSLGHAAGDLALKHVAEILISSVRASDVVGRLGGDEFGVILLQSEGPAAAAKAAQLAEAIATAPLAFDGQLFSIDVAFGVHTLTAGDQVDEALEAADRAMYVQKRSRRT